MPKTLLKTAPLGTTGLEITRIGLGAWAIGGGGWEAGWGPQDDDESVSAILHALEHGVNWIDTAAAYGFGHSERIVGRALEAAAERQDIRLALHAAAGLGVTLPSAETADDMLARARELGYGERDVAALHQVLARQPLASR
jgi:diketogulonate reductase-like aldo/keto reductase